jgi:signal transduction histidine kinase
MITPKKNNLVYCNINLTFQNKELGDAIQLKTFSLGFQSKHQEIAKIKSQLKTAKRAPSIQNNEKEKRAAELIIANNELAFQNNEKEKRAAELIIANKELAFQNDEKEKRASELIIANKELAFQNDEKEKRAAELIIANKQLAFQNDEKEKRAAELMLTNIELKCAEESQKEYIRGLEQIMYLTSHKVRQPIANILGLTVMLDLLNDSKEDITQSIEHIKKSALSLDILTRELNAHVLYLKKKLKI